YAFVIRPMKPLYLMPFEISQYHLLVDRYIHKVHHFPTQWLTLGSPLRYKHVITALSLPLTLATKEVLFHRHLHRHCIVHLLLSTIFLATGFASRTYKVS